MKAGDNVYNPSMNDEKEIRGATINPTVKSISLVESTLSPGVDIASVK